MARSFGDADGITETFATSDETATLDVSTGLDTTGTFTSSDDSVALDFGSGLGPIEGVTTIDGVIGIGWGAETGEPPLSPGATNGDDTLYGTSANDSIHAGHGHDVLKGFGGADVLDGGTGIDTVFYGDSTVGVAVNLATGYGHGGSAEGDRLFRIENVYGSYYNDTLTGNDASNELYGLDGNDVLKGGGGADGLAGGSGDDILKGGGGADYLEGGAGSDTADYSLAPAASIFDGTPFEGSIGVQVNLGANQGFWGDASGDTFSGIENVTGSQFTDLLIGSDGANALRGMDGGDRLDGLGGSDTLDGGGGNDILDGGAGIDTMLGGLGDETYYVDNASDVIVEAGGQGMDAVFASVSFTLTAGADVETLRTASDTGVDAINLTGNANGNVVLGNAGNNVINGGDGRDELTGLGGQDSFLFDTPLNVAFNVDVITDFNVADDTIRLDDDIFSSDLLAGNSVADSQFVIGAAALDAGDRIIYNSASGAVYYDSDGTGAAAQIQFAQLSPGLGLTHFDFLVVA